MQKGKLRSLSAGFVPSAPRWTGRERVGEYTSVQETAALSVRGKQARCPRLLADVTIFRSFLFGLSTSRLLILSLFLSFFLSFYD